MINASSLGMNVSVELPRLEDRGGRKVDLLAGLGRELLGDIVDVDRRELDAVDHEHARVARCSRSTNTRVWLSTCTASGTGSTLSIVSGRLARSSPVMLTARPAPRQREPDGDHEAEREQRLVDPASALARRSVAVGSGSSGVRLLARVGVDVGLGHGPIMPGGDRDRHTCRTSESRTSPRGEAIACGHRGIRRHVSTSLVRAR